MCLKAAVPERQNNKTREGKPKQKTRQRAPASCAWRPWCVTGCPLRLVARFFQDNRLGGLPACPAPSMLGRAAEPVPCDPSATPPCTLIGNVPPPARPPSSRSPSCPQAALGPRTRTLPDLLGLLPVPTRSPPSRPWPARNRPAAVTHLAAAARGSGGPRGADVGAGEGQGPQRASPEGQLGPAVRHFPHWVHTLWNARHAAAARCLGRNQRKNHAGKRSSASPHRVVITPWRLCGSLVGGNAGELGNKLGWQKLALFYSCVTPKLSVARRC